jgi:hypothetical protein
MIVLSRLAGPVIAVQAAHCRSESVVLGVILMAEWETRRPPLVVSVPGTAGYAPLFLACAVSTAAVLVSAADRLSGHAPAVPWQARVPSALAKMLRLG